MNCYLCQRQRVDMSAVAVCQGCGAGCCLEHVEERVHPGRGPGLQPMQSPRIELLCQRCLALHAPLLARTRRQVKAIRSASSVLKTGSTPALPDAQEMISAAEDLLGLRSSPVANQRKPGGWLRFFKGLRLR
ncbi:MAG TPA: DUF2180 family protein [Ktedonobacterales bacterium]